MADSPQIPDTAVPAAPVETAPQAVNVLDPMGQLVSLPADQVQAALQEGYSPAGPEHIAAYEQKQKYGTPGQMALTAAEGAAKAATFGASTAVERASGLTTGKDILAREKENPRMGMIGQGIGLLTPGAPEAEALNAVGHAAASAAGLGKIERAAQAAKAAGEMAPLPSFITRIGSSAAKMAAETAMVQGGDEVSKALAGDPDQSMQSALVDIGLAGLFGGVTGGAIGTVPAIWQATMGNKAHGVLKAIADKMGGIEGQEGAAAVETVNPVVDAAANPAIRLNHYSAKDNLKEVDPSFFGSGVRGAEAKRAPTTPRSYYYFDNTAPEDIVKTQSPHKYNAQLPEGAKLYDIAKDPEKILDNHMLPSGAPEMDGVEAEIKAKGYSGYYNSGHYALPHAVAVFDKLPVTKDLGNNEVRNLAASYAKSKGIELQPSSSSAKVDVPRAQKIAQAYEEMQHAPNDPAVKKAYNALIQETMDQFQALKKNGLKIFRIEPGMENPYKTSADLHADIKNNNHLWYYPTELGFGTAGSPTKHPLLTPTVEFDKGKPLLANDIFRIVHDIFGHVKEGSGFGPKGEEGAWREHMKMYSPEAQKALTTETRGQNSWVNYGPYGEANRANPANTRYADQKAGLMPAWTMSTELSAPTKISTALGDAAVKNAIQASGMELDPVIQAGLSSDPAVQEMFNGLNQTDTNASGLEVQKRFKAFRQRAGEVISEALGKSLAEVPDEISKYESGKSIGKALADEYQEKMSPLTKAYDDIRNKYSKIELNPSVEDKAGNIAKQQEKLVIDLNRATRLAVKAQQAGDVAASLEHAARVQDLQSQIKDLSQAAKKPGHTDVIINNLMALADKEGWTASPSSDIMREVNRAAKEVPNLKTVKDLGNYITAVGNNMQSDPLNGAMTRAGGMIKQVLKTAEADIVGKAVGSEEGVSAVHAFEDARKAYAAQSRLKEALDESLHARGSTAGYAKAVREMAQRDGETVLNRLSGKNDAALLQILQQDFPKTAALVRDYHVNSLLSAAKEGESLRPEKFLKNLKNLSPELRSFIASPQALDKAGAVGELLEHFNKMPHNFSNTARTIDKLSEHIPGTVLGTIAALTGHNPIVAALVGSLTKTFAKDAPDAIKLATLKMLGSQAPVDARGMKAAIDFIHHAIKGENLIGRSTKNIFKAGVEVLPQAAIPNERDRNRLDKHLKELRTNQSPLQDVGGKLSHYMPEHATAAATTATAASNYLNSLRPDTSKRAPLDSKLPATPQQKANYNNALDIAQQPLLILDKIQKGTLLPDDLAHLKTMFPSLAAKLQQKVTQEMIAHLDKDDSISYKTRMSLSLFLGQPVDSTMTPAAITSAQPLPAMPPNGPQSSSQHNKTGSALNKLSSMYQTPQQAAEAHKAQHRD